MWEFLRAVFFGLVPPPADDPNHAKLILRWRVNVSVTLGVLVMTVAGNIAIAFGFVPIFFPGFARANDVSDTKALIAQVRVSQLDNEIFAAHQSACLAIYQKNRDLAVQYEQRVQLRLPLYQRLNGGQPYQLQPCVGGF